jgi:excisionase family DNA binding protein
VLLDKEQAAELLATTPRHVERLVEDGRLGFCRVGRFIRFALPDLQQYMADNHVDPRQREL